MVLREPSGGLFSFRRSCVGTPLLSVPTGTVGTREMLWHGHVRREAVPLGKDPFGEVIPFANAEGIPSGPSGWEKTFRPTSRRRPSSVLL